MKIDVDKKTGKIRGDDGTELLFKGRKLHISSDKVLAAVSFERLGEEGTKLAIYNDLERQGLSTTDANRLMQGASTILRQMGFTLEII